MLFVLKLIKNGVTELLEGSAAPKSDPHPATDRSRSRHCGSPQSTIAGGLSRQRSISQGRPLSPPAAAAKAASVVGGKGEERKDSERKQGGGKKRVNEEEEMDDETLEAAVRDLRTCMGLVMKRLDIGTANQTIPYPQASTSTGIDTETEMAF